LGKRNLDEHILIIPAPVNNDWALAQEFTPSALRSMIFSYSDFSEGI